MTDILSEPHIKNIIDIERTIQQSEKIEEDKRIRDALQARKDDEEAQDTANHIRDLFMAYHIIEDDDNKNEYLQGLDREEMMGIREIYILNLICIDQKADTDVPLIDKLNNDISNIKLISKIIYG